MVPVPQGQAVSDPSSALITLPEEPTLSNRVAETTPTKPNIKSRRKKEDEPTAASAEQPCANAENNEPEKKVKSCSETPLPDSASSMAPAEEDMPPAAAIGELRSHKFMPTLALTATHVSEPRVTSVTTGLSQGPKDLQDETLEEEPKPLTKPEAAKVQEIDVNKDGKEKKTVKEELTPADKTTVQSEPVFLS